MKLGENIVNLLQYKFAKFGAPSSLSSEVITKIFWFAKSWATVNNKTSLNILGYDHKIVKTYSAYL